MAGMMYPGAEQILAARNQILAKYDHARAQSRSHKAETYHGNVGEAVIREWLTDFLPKRYAVTAGYVVSQSPLKEKLPHFDVIIYDQLESPTIWIEGNPDRTAAGSSRAIPVEHVLGVIEVKAALQPGPADAAVDHLSELLPYLSGFDPPAERYKKFLPERFFCIAMFLELREDDFRSRSSLDKLLIGTKLRGFRGAIVLRRGKDERQATGKYEIHLAARDQAGEMQKLERLLQPQLHLAIRWTLPISVTS